jgi:hypothetical protein
LTDAEEDKEITANGDGMPHQNEMLFRQKRGKMVRNRLKGRKMMQIKHIIDKKKLRIGNLMWHRLKK